MSARPAASSPAVPAAPPIVTSVVPHPAPMATLAAPPPPAPTPESLRDAILKASEHLFSRHGYEGTSLRDIGHASGVSIGLIHYHFDTKERLYGAVRERVIARYLEARQKAAPVGVGTVAETIRGATAHYLAFIDEMPSLTRLTAWARLEGRAEPVAAQTDLIDRLADFLRAEQTAGRIKAGVNIDLLLFAWGGMCNGWEAARDSHLPRLASLGDTAARRQAYVDLCAKALLEGIQGKTK